MRPGEWRETGRAEERRWQPADGGRGSYEEGLRTIDLPPLPGLSEGELGPLAAGDWVALITPMMKDLSASSARGGTRSSRRPCRYMSSGCRVNRWLDCIYDPGCPRLAAGSPGRGWNRGGRR